MSSGVIFPMYPNDCQILSRIIETFGGDARLYSRGFGRSGRRPRRRDLRHSIVPWLGVVLNAYDSIQQLRAQVSDRALGAGR